ncbi:PREDICTED: uncharacterized protein LOC109582416 [Amphimedon queenslandica]|uniref:Death domain-containing protein n=1 Tax=Amphimedon queenslandica TaxID=400682 RepID=A0A1X7USX2_AMPQE|nr:PREDICTED: uncharacterized protein LOC109582416 [Amphimedon queenslandica]|eukprot:XP_019852660.1 PREDICTED: uncharacterized protein LOC109582416 [Amphimedon queenslandica]
MVCNKDLTYEEFLDQKPPLQEVIAYIDIENEWLMLGVILALTKDAIYQLPRGTIAGKPVSLLELWLKTPTASRRQLLEGLRKDPAKQDAAENFERHLNDTYEAADCKQAELDKKPGSFVSGKDIAMVEPKENQSHVPASDSEHRMKMKDYEIENLKEKESELNSEIRELRANLGANEEKLNNIVKKKDSEIETLNATIEKKESELQATILSNEEKIIEIEDKMKLSIKDKENEFNSEIEELKAFIRRKEEEIFESQEKLKMHQKISKMKDLEIENLRARLERREQDIKWGSFEVHLTSPSAEQCKDVLTRIEDKHQHVYLSDSSSSIAQLLVGPLLQIKNIRSLYIFSTPLTQQFFDFFSSQISGNDTLESLYLNHNSISDVGVTTLVQSLKPNRKLQYLSLEFNTQITSLSVPLLADLICSNCTLSVLDVSNTSIDADGVLDLVDSLKFNTKLGKLVVDQKHKAICSQFVGRLDFSYKSTTAYENFGTTKVVS